MVLKVSPGFLARPISVKEQGEPFFRALTRTPAAEKKRARSYALLLAEIVELLDEHVEMPAVEVRRLLDADEATPDAAIEQAAVRARAMWRVPPGPVAHVVGLAEARGVAVAAVGDFDERMDAFSLRTTKRPVVVLCTAKGVATRRRFDMAHELGHLVLHSRRLEDQAKQEQQANRFAAAFLMPAGEVDDYLPVDPRDLSRLEDVSRGWGVSMQAALYRAKTLGVMSADDHVRAMKRLSAAGWRRREPLEIGPAERPELLRKALAALPSAGITLAELADQFGVPEARLDRMLATPENQDDAVRANVVQLRRSVLARNR